MLLVGFNVVLCPVGKSAAQAKSTWAAVWLSLIGLAMIASGGYLFYKYRIRVSFTA